MIPELVIWFSSYAHSNFCKWNDNWMILDPHMCLSREQSIMFAVIGYDSNTTMPMLI